MYFLPLQNCCINHEWEERTFYRAAALHREAGHMGAWDLAFQSYEAKSNINEAGNRYPLLSLIQSADNMATHILEQ